ncbi:MAG: hypothetical protein ACRCXD_11950, partial [Luteolibacter sp.]
MRIVFAEVLLGACFMASCGQMGPPPEMGDLEAGGDPAEGGIVEVPNPNASMAQKSGKALADLQRGHEVYMLQCGQCHRYVL